MSNTDLVLITGASGGVGKVLTALLIEAGWRNIVCQYSTRPDGIAEVLSSHGLDPRERLFRADLTDEAQAAALHKRVRDAFGTLYGLVTLAGGSSNAVSWKLSADEFRKILDVNLMSTILACREFIPEMREQSRGRIINISSVVAYTGAAGTSHYAAAKAAVIGLSKSLALELAPKKIPVSVVALGYFQYGLINTIPQEHQDRIKANIPTQRFGEAGELAGLVSYLLNESGAYAGGQVYHLNGGLYT
jgi:NAD(P)-dependent dehydrogenase (short-subunit alcohol dehydrogenase family)